MRKRIAALAVLMAVTASVCAEGVYTQGRTAVYNSDDYLPQLSQMNADVLAEQGDYDPDRKPPEESKATESQISSSDTEGTSESGTESSTDSVTSEADKPVNEAIEPAPIEEEAPDFTALYTDRMALVQEYNDLVEAQSSELTIKLIDYDVALKKFKVKTEDYYKLKDASTAAENSYRLGNVEYKEYEAAVKSCEDLYFEIKSDLFDISVMKSEIEGITGQTLKDSFDFDSLYYITDALTFDAASYTDMSDFDTICQPTDYAAEEKAPVDCSGQLNDAIKQYYALGDLMRDHISAAQALKQAKEDIRMGYADISALEAAQSAYNTSYLAAYEGKAAYAKALIALDDALGNAVIAPLAMSGELAGVYKRALPSEINGTGFWQIRSSGSTAFFVPVSYPKAEFADKDLEYYYTISYNGKQIGKADANTGCTLRRVKYSAEAPYAEITFYLGKKAAGSYKLDVFSPVGAFIG